MAAGWATLRLVLFLLIVMPLLYLFLIWQGAFLIYSFWYIGGWNFQEAFRFMGKTATQGAIVLTDKDFTGTVPYERFVVAGEGATCLGIFGFVVAIMKDSVTEPLAKSMGLNKKTNVCGLLCKLMSLFIVCIAIVAAALGGISMLFQDWEWAIGFQTFLDVQLGGGFSKAVGKVPKWDDGRYHFPAIILCIWAFGVACMLIALFSGPLVLAFEGMCGLKQKKGASMTMALVKFTAYIFLVLPLIMLLFMALVATVCGLNRQFADWSDYFWYALPTVSSSAVAVLDFDGKLDWLSRIALIFGATIGFFILTTSIAIGGELLRPVLAFMGLGKSRACCDAFCTMLLSSVFIMPALVYLFSLPVGGFMAIYNGWSFSDGFFWSVQGALGGGMLISPGKIESTFPRFIGVFVAAVSIGLASFAVAVNSSPAVAPLIAAIGMSLKDGDSQETADDEDNEEFQELIAEGSEEEASDDKDEEVGEEEAEGSEEEEEKSTCVIF